MQNKLEVQCMSCYTIRKDNPRLNTFFINGYPPFPTDDGAKEVVCDKCGKRTSEAVTTPLKEICGGCGGIFRWEDLYNLTHPNYGSSAAYSCAECLVTVKK